MIDATAVQSSVSAVQQANSAGGDDAVQTLMLKRALDLQARDAAQLISALPAQAALATEGSVGTRVNTYA